MAEKVFLFISGQQVDMATDASIKFVFNNNMFSSDSVAGQYSYPFRLPLTATNKKIFDFPAELTKAYSVNRLYTAHLFLSGMPALKGNLSINSITNNYLEVNFNANISELSNFWNDREIRSLYFGSNIHIGTSDTEIITHFNDTRDGSKDYVFAPIRNDNIPSSDFSVSQYFNLYDQVADTHLRYDNAGRAVYHTAYPFVSKVISYLCNNYRLDYVPGPMALELAGLIFYSPAILEGLSQGITALNGGSGLWMKINDFLPNKLTISDLLNSLKNMFNLSYDYNAIASKFKIVNNTDVLISGQPVDWSGKVSNDYTISVEKLEQYFQFVMTLDTTDEYYKEFVDPYSYDYQTHVTVDRKITTKASTINRIFVPTSSDALGYDMPLVKQEAQGDNEALRLLLYNGMKTISSGRYPFVASSNSVIQMAWNVTPSLAIPDPRLLYFTRWKEWTSMLAKSPSVKFPVNLNILDIINLDMTEKKHIRGKNYFIKKIEIELPIRKPATVEFIQINQ